MRSILIFGDSIALGFSDIEGGWTQRLRRSLEESSPGTHFAVYNLGIAGNRVGDILARFELEAAARIDPEDEVVIIIAVGTNDAAIVRERQDHWTPLTDFAQSLKEVGQRARALTPLLMYVGLTPVDDSKVNPCPWHLSFAYRMSDATQYDTSVRETAAKLDIHFVDVMKPFLTKDDWKTLLADGLHPSGEGHELIAKEVLLTLEKLAKQKKERDAA